MSKRLEEIKEMNGVINHKNPAWQEEIDWLINRVEELEEDNHDVRTSCKEWYDSYFRLRGETQRYKQALELIHKDTLFESEHDLISPIHVIRKRVEKVLGESE